VKQGCLTESDFEYGPPAKHWSFRGDFIASRNKLMHGDPHLSPQFSVMMEFDLQNLTKFFPASSPW
jgi:hypothetical protein